MRQHDYIKSLSTETDLQEVLRIIARALTFKLYTMTVLLDTEEDFNNVSTFAIQ